MAIVGNNTLLNQYVPTFCIKNIQDGQTLVYDAVRKSFVNSDAGGGTGGVNRLGELLDVAATVDNPLSLQTGQALVYNSTTSLWENVFLDFNTLQNKPTNSSYSFSGLSDTATPSLPNGYVQWNDTGTQLVYSTTIPASSITGLAQVAFTGDYNDLLNIPTTGGTVTEVTVVNGSDIVGSVLNSTTTPEISLSLTDVNADIGTYGSDLLVPQITVDSKGRITGITNVPISASGVGTVTSVSGTDVSGVAVSVTNPTSTPEITVTLGDITPASVAATGTVTGSNLSGTNTGDQVILLTGDVTGTGTGEFETTLKTVNLTPGTYADSHFVPTITVNNKGLVTSVTVQHVDTSVRDLVEEVDVIVISQRHQYIVTGTMEVLGRIENNGRIAIL